MKALLTFLSLVVVALPQYALAEPETIIRPNFPAIIEVGAEIPFKTIRSRQSGQNKQIITTVWKFTGLKLKITLKHVGDLLKIEYQTGFSRPDDSGKISGSKEKSSAMITLGIPLQIFQIGLKTSGISNSYLPGLGMIPILGEIFKSKSKQNNYKILNNGRF